MRKQILAATSLLVAALSISATQAQVPVSQAGPGPNCLSVYDIKSTKVLDPQTIVFRMKDGVAWKNTLKNRCSGLLYWGFEYKTHDEAVCANSQAIHVLVSRETCVLGRFVPYAPHA